MPRIIQSIHLSDYQALTMLLIQQAPTPELAFAELGKQDPQIESNILGARDTLIKIGLVQANGREVSITPEGEKVMSDEYLVDEMGELTEKSEELLSRTVKEPTSDNQGPTDAPQSDNGMPQGADMAPTTNGGEMETTPGGIGETSMLKLINDIVRLND